MVFGSRTFGSHSAYGFWYVLGNQAVSMTANILFNSWLSDIMTCHKMMPTEMFRSLSIRQKGFAVEAEITAHLLRRRILICEVNINYVARSREAGKKLTSMDGVRVFWTLLLARLG